MAAAARGRRPVLAQGAGDPAQVAPAIETVFASEAAVSHAAQRFSLHAPHACVAYAVQWPDACLLQGKPKDWVVADFGCGDAQIGAR